MLLMVPIIGLKKMGSLHAKAPPPLPHKRLVCRHVQTPADTMERPPDLNARCARSALHCGRQ